VSRTEKIAMGVLALIAIVLAHPICNLFFRCGCGWLGPAHCNIHAIDASILAGTARSEAARLAPLASSMGPHCPWCVNAAARFPFVLFAWAAGVYGGARAAKKSFGGGAGVVFGGGLIGLLLGAVLSGTVTVVLTGYPHFLLW
jgi:hypothetical protein